MPVPICHTLEKQISPSVILESAWSFAPTRILATALELDLFTLISQGNQSVHELATCTAASSRGLAMMMNALVALKYLEMQGESYVLPAVSKAFLVRSSPDYIGTYVVHNAAESWRAWANLTDAVRNGAPVRTSVHGDHADAQFFLELVQCTSRLNTHAADQLACLFHTKAGINHTAVLDLGAGSAVWSIAMARRWPHVRVTAVDLPEVVDGVTRRLVKEAGVADQFTFRSGNFHDIDFGSGAFDIVVFGHICHGEGARSTKFLLGRAMSALRSGGHLVMAEICPDDDRRGPLLPLLFAIHMLILTDDGDAFTLAEYKGWLQETGFTDIRTVALDALSPLILATKL
jgi:2-polyprenyl-3-methyl-5-hydroxy-6-metoxy-1,4-benzoquinol methylase